MEKCDRKSLTEPKFEPDLYGFEVVQRPAELLSPFGAVRERCWRIWRGSRWLYLCFNCGSLRFLGKELTARERKSHKQRNFILCAAICRSRRALRRIGVNQQLNFFQSLAISPRRTLASSQLLGRVVRL